MPFFQFCRILLNRRWKIHAEQLKTVLGQVKNGEITIDQAVERLRNEFDPVPWVKTYCPICGSLPYLSLLRGEIGKRYLLCSFCGTSWETERLVCPFCSNKEQESLHYFCGEGEEAYRIDLCDQCHQYIKTIDLRNTTGSDLCLEDLSTLHLDFLASQKGYQRPTPTVWTIWNTLLIQRRMAGHWSL